MPRPPGAGDARRRATARSVGTRDGPHPRRARSSHAGARCSGGTLRDSRSRLPCIVASRLLKSCAMPPASCPTTCSFCDCTSAASVFCRSAISTCSRLLLTSSSCVRSATLVSNASACSRSSCSRRAQRADQIVVGGGDLAELRPVVLRQVPSWPRSPARQRRAASSSSRVGRPMNRRATKSVSEECADRDSAQQQATAQAGPIDVGHQVGFVEADRDQQVMPRLRIRNVAQDTLGPVDALQSRNAGLRGARPAAMPSAGSRLPTNAACPGLRARIVPSRSATESTLLARKRDPVWRAWFRCCASQPRSSPVTRMRWRGRIRPGQRKGEGQEAGVQDRRRRIATGREARGGQGVHAPRPACRHRSGTARIWTRRPRCRPHRSGQGMRTSAGRG